MMSDEGTFGDFSFQIRKTNGKAQDSYLWYQDYIEDDGGWQPGYWHHAQSGADIGPDNDVKFVPGDGFWFTIGNDYGKIDGALKNAGEAIVDAQSVAIRNGNKGIAVPVSFDVKLYAGKVRPTGYEDNEDMQSDEGTFGDFSFQILKTNGKALVSYLWYQDYIEDDGGWQEGYWHCAQSGADIGADNDVTLKAGQGLWFTVGNDYGTFENATLEFPGIDE